MSNMRLVQPSLQELYPMLLAFHAKAGNCGYTVRQSLVLAEPALNDPLQVIMGIRTVSSSGESEDWVGYIWVQLQDTFSFVLQVWSKDLAATRLLANFAEQWSKERGAYTIRGSTSRKWLRAMERRWGYVVTQTIIEKRL